MGHRPPLRSQDPLLAPAAVWGSVSCPRSPLPSHCPRWAAIKAERQLTWSVVLTVRQGCRLHARGQEGGRGRAGHSTPHPPPTGGHPGQGWSHGPRGGSCPGWGAAHVTELPPTPTPARPGLRQLRRAAAPPLGSLRSTWAPEVPAPLMGGVGVPPPSSEGPGQGLQMAIVPAVPPGVPATQTLWGRLWSQPGAGPENQGPQGQAERGSSRDLGAVRGGHPRGQEAADRLAPFEPRSFPVMGGRGPRQTLSGSCTRGVRVSPGEAARPGAGEGDVTREPARDPPAGGAALPLPGRRGG